jgi:hypothetical protein
MNYLYVSKLMKELEELEDEVTEMEEAVEEAKEELNTFLEMEDATEGDIEDAELKLGGAENDIETWDEYDRLQALRQLKSDLGSDWGSGTTLIPESEFKNYARDFAIDLGMDHNEPWPYDCIDWEVAADSLAYDYQRVDFDGEEYLYQSY